MLGRLDEHDGACPSGASITGPLLLFLQQAGVGGLSVEEAGTQYIPQLEPALFVQDKWQPTPNLTVQYGLRWEAQIQPDPITPPSEVFFAAFIGKPGVPLRRHDPVRQGACGSRGSASRGIRQGDGKQVIRLSAGIFYSRIPGLRSRARARPTAAAARRSSATAPSTASA